MAINQSAKPAYGRSGKYLICPVSPFERSRSAAEASREDNPAFTKAIISGYSHSVQTVGIGGLLPNTYQYVSFRSEPGAMRYLIFDLRDLAEPM